MAEKSIKQKKRSEKKLNCKISNNETRNHMCGVWREFSAISPFNITFLLSSILFTVDFSRLMILAVTPRCFENTLLMLMFVWEDFLCYHIIHQIVSRVEMEKNRKSHFQLLISCRTKRFAVSLAEDGTEKLEHSMVNFISSSSNFIKVLYCFIIFFLFTFQIS